MKSASKTASGITSLLNSMPNNSDRLLLVAFIVLLCWFLNYLSIKGYGLYYDDWPAIADFTKLKLWGGVNSPFGWLEIWPHGRPLGWFLLSALGWPGRESGELTDLYFVGFFIVSTVGILVFLIIDRKFGRTAGVLSAFFFLASPVDTTRLELTLNYIAHTGLIFSLLAIWTYQHNRKYLAYGISALALLCYESTYFLFVAAPLLTLSLYSLRTWKLQILHGAVCLLIIIAISAIRYWVFDSAFAVHQSQHGRNAVEALFLGMYNYTIHYFDFFLFGIQQGFKNLTILSVVLGLLICTPLVVLVYKSRTYNSGYQTKYIVELFSVGSVLLLLGLVTSGFADYYPGLPFGGRNTRVYVAAAIGGGVVITSLLLLSLQWAKKSKITPAAFILLFIVSFGVTSNSLKIQSDYVEAWDIQKQAFRSALDLSCDANLGDSIILVPQEPAWDKGRAIHPYGFGFSTAIADTFDWGSTHFSQIPNLMKAPKDWFNFLELGNDGLLHWKQLKLSGFQSLAMAPVEPESIIYLKGTKRGLIRVNAPIMIDGVNVLKPIPPSMNSDDCLFRTKELTGPIAPFLFPDLFAFSP